jgi:hypothetical protein
MNKTWRCRSQISAAVAAQIPSVSQKMNATVSWQMAHTVLHVRCTALALAAAVLLLVCVLTEWGMQTQ